MKKIYKIFLLIIVFIVSDNSFAYQSNLTTDQIIFNNKINNFNKFILEKLNSYEIICIGDSKHHDYFYASTVIDLLNYWIDQAKFQKFPSRILLVLENEEAFNACFQKFMTTGNYQDLIYSLDQINRWTLSDFQFFGELKEIKRKISELHQDLNLSILFPEKTIPLSNYSKDQGNKYFLHQRDIDNSAKVDSFLTKKSGYRTIIYYGNFHINKLKGAYEIEGEKHTDIPTFANCLIEKGYSLYSIEQTSSFYNPLQIYFTPDKIGSFLIETKLIAKKTSYISSNGTDSYIYLKDQYPYNDLILQNLLSKFIFKEILEFALYKDNRYNLSLKMAAKLVSQYLADKNDIRPTKESILEAIENIDVFQSILELDFIHKKLLVAQNSNSITVDQLHSAMVQSVGIYGNFSLIKDKEEALKFWEDQIKMHQKFIQLRYLIPLIFLGTSEEIEKAYNYVKTILPFQFKNREECLKLYRKNFSELYLNSF